MNEKIKELANIEEEFFQLDKENKIAFMKLEFANTDEVFDKNSITKIPIFNDEFSEWLKSAFAYAPKGYKIDLDITFDDLGEYSEEQLKEIFIKNAALELKVSQRNQKYKSKIALSLFATGIIFLVAMILVAALWQEERALKEIIVAIIEIASWVTIWEALDIFIVEHSERRNYMKSLAKRFKSINFHKKA